LTALSPGHEEEFFAEVDRMLGTAVKREFHPSRHLARDTADGDLYDAMSASLLAEDPQAKVAPYCLSRGGTDANGSVSSASVFSGSAR